MNEPVGDLCVISDPDHRQWSVAICQGEGRRQVLQRFESQDLAAEYAIEERARRQQLSSGPMTIHFPDDCPCRGNEMKW
jgi:hypothetical protein